VKNRQSLKASDDIPNSGKENPELKTEFNKRGSLLGKRMTRSSIIRGRPPTFRK